MSKDTVLNTKGSSRSEVSDDGQITDYLEHILTRQLEKLRKYDLDGAMNLAHEVNDIAANVGKKAILDRPEYEAQRKRIHQLYKEIGLVIASERQEVSEKVRQIRKGLKALGHYRENM